jgi:hypothetical protein
MAAGPDLSSLSHAQKDALIASLMAQVPGNAQHSLTTTAIRASLFVFVTNWDLEATNNGSERALRPCAVYRKITNGFRSEWGAKFYADIRSVVETARRRAIRAIDAIRITLRGQTLNCAQ